MGRVGRSTIATVRALFLPDDVGGLPQVPMTPLPNLYPTAALAHVYASGRIAAFLGFRSALRR